MANYPTPDNIQSITYQLLQEINDPASIRGQLPVLTIQFIDGNSVVRNKVVGFQEMLPYLKMLKAKATATGNLLYCDPEQFYDKKIVFIPGSGVPPIVNGMSINNGTSSTIVFFRSSDGTYYPCRPGAVTIVPRDVDQYFHYSWEYPTPFAFPPSGGMGLTFTYLDGVTVQQTDDYKLYSDGAYSVPVITFDTINVNESTLNTTITLLKNTGTGAAELTINNFSQEQTDRFWTIFDLLMVSIIDVLSDNVVYTYFYGLNVINTKPRADGSIIENFGGAPQAWAVTGNEYIVVGTFISNSYIGATQSFSQRITAAEQPVLAPASFVVRNALTNPCVVSTKTVYAANGSLFAPGTQLYNDPLLTDTTGLNHEIVQDLPGAPIYDVFNGLIGAATGANCP